MILRRWWGGAGRCVCVCEGKAADDVLSVGRRVGLWALATVL